MWDETRIISVLGFGASYIRDFTVFCFQTLWMNPLSNPITTLPWLMINIQLSAVIMRSRLSRYHIQHIQRWQRQNKVEHYTHKRHPILRPHGWAMGCEDFEQNWPCYNGPALASDISMTRCISYTVNTMPADAMATIGARNGIDQLSQNI